MQKIWASPNSNPELTPDLQNDLSRKLSLELNISEKLISLLLQRKIYNYEEARKFFRPNLEDIPNPFLMKGMDEAVDRISKAILNNEAILLYGDYDVDGTTAVSLLYRFLSPLHKSLNYYLPNREKEGYGVSMAGIKWAIENKIKLIISLDCGIKSIQEVAFAKENGIDFLICDHHLPENNLPEALAILNPKQDDCLYPFKFLSGCGIAYKLAQAYSEKKIGAPLVNNELLDLVAMSIACDLVEVEDENRILAFHGLKKLNSNPNSGIESLLKISREKKSLPQSSKPIIQFQDILFQLGPRINAAGRLGDAHRVVELFTTNNPKLAESISRDLNELNQKRKELELEITAQAIAQLVEQVRNSENQYLILGPPGPNNKKAAKCTNVLFNPSWHKGLVGIVASRVMEKYYLPTIILTESQNKITGSARSVEGFNIYEAIHECRHLLEQYGGHSAAAGLSMAKENLGLFKEAFEKVVSKIMDGKPSIPKLYYHEELFLEDITPSFFRILEQFAPFGPKNPIPQFITKKIRFSSPAQKIKDIHAKFYIQKGTEVLTAIGFGLGNLTDHLNYNSDYDICYQIEMNTFRGNSSLQIILKDLILTQ